MNEVLQHVRGWPRAEGGLPNPSRRAAMEFDHDPADWLVAVTIGKLNSTGDLVP